ncbi:MAG: hypothetical protein RR351_04560, partial [Christensenella sp.]
MRNNISSSVITFGASSYSVGNTGVGGFVGLNSNPAASYFNNYYLGTVGANGYFADSVALRVGTASTPVITDDAQIKRGAPITFANVVQTPNTWARGVKVSADITADASVTLDPAKIFVAPSKDATTGVPLVKGAGNNYATAAGAVMAEGKQYIIAYGTNGLSQAVEFESKVDATSPNISGVAAKRYSATDMRPTATVVDLKSGVASVFASQAATAPPADGRVVMNKVGATDVYDAAAGVDMTKTWYVYAVDAVGNISAAGTKIEKIIDPTPGVMTKDSQGRWEVQSGEDMQAIGTGVYLMTDSYIVVQNITVTNPTWTPIGNATNGTTPFAGVFDGGNFAIDFAAVKTWNTVVVNGSHVGVGVFGFINGGSVKNMTINNVTANVSVSTDNACVYAGAVAARVQNGALGTVERINANNVNINLTNTTGVIEIGGAFGELWYST